MFKRDEASKSINLLALLETLWVYLARDETLTGILSQVHRGVYKIQLWCLMIKMQRSKINRFFFSLLLSHLWLVPILSLCDVLCSDALILSTDVPQGSSQVRFGHVHLDLDLSLLHLGLQLTNFLHREKEKACVYVFVLVLIKQHGIADRTSGRTNLKHPHTAGPETEACHAVLK